MAEMLYSSLLDELQDEILEAGFSTDDFDDVFSLSYCANCCIYALGT